MYLCYMKIENNKMVWMTDVEYKLVTSRIPIPGVDLVILRKTGKGLETLLIKNKINRAANGMWGLIGGRQYLGETLDVTIQRQAKELGLKVKVIPPFSFEFPAMVNSSTKQDTHKHPTCNVYPVIVISGKLKKTGNEHEDLKWFDVADLPNICLDQGRQIKITLNKLKQYSKYLKL